MDPLSFWATTERQYFSRRINRSISVSVTGFSRDLEDDDEVVWCVL